MRKKAVSLWLDKDSCPGESSWVVSLDELDNSGGAITSQTLICLPANEHNYNHIREAGMKIAKDMGLPFEEEE